MTRSPLLIGAATAALLALAGCSTGAATPAPSGSSAPVTLTFDSYSFATPGDAQDVVTELIASFEQSHPGITVEARGVPAGDILTKAKTETAAGDPPDVVQLGYSKLAEAEQTLPLQSIEQIAGDEWGPAVEGMSSAVLKTGEFDGSVHALPFTVSIPAMFYNADLFRAAGLDPDDPPTTIDEMSAAGAKIAATGAYGAYFGIADTAQSDYITQSVINSNGGASVNAKGDITVDSAKAIAALAAVQKLTKDGVQPTVGVNDALAAFSSGKLGMFVVSTALTGSLKKAADGKFELRSSGFPGFAGQAPKPTFSGAGLVVLSADEAKQRAAWQFVDYLTGKEAETLITKRIGYVPLREGLADDPAYLKDFLAEDPLLRPSIDQLPRVAPYTSYSGPQANQATVLLQTDAVEPIVLQGADPATTLQSVADRMRQLTGTR